MKWRIILVAVLVTFGLSCHANIAQSSLTRQMTINKMRYVMLLQPDELVSKPVSEFSLLSRHLSNVQNIIDAQFDNLPSDYVNQGSVILALNDKGESRVWFDFDKKIDEKIIRQITQKAQALSPDFVKSQSILVAMAYSLGGGVFDRQMPDLQNWQPMLVLPDKSMQIDEIILQNW